MFFPRTRDAAGERYRDFGPRAGLAAALGFAAAFFVGTCFATGFVAARGRWACSGFAGRPAGRDPVAFSTGDFAFAVALWEAPLPCERVGVEPFEPTRVACPSAARAFA